MKILIFLLCFIPTLAFAGYPSWSDLSNYVNQSISQFTNATAFVPGDSTVTAFIASNSIVDSGTKSDLYNGINELSNPRYGNYRSNLVDAVFLYSRFNPTNNLTLYGRPFTASNVVWQTRGALLNGGLITFSNLVDLRTNTIVIVYTFPRNIAPVFGQGGWVAGAVDPATGNSFGLGDQEQEYKKLYYSVGSQLWANTGNTLTNLVLSATPYNNYFYPTFAIEGQRNVSIISAAGPLVAEYETWNPSELNFYNPTVSPISTGVPQTVPLNSIYIGGWGINQGSPFAYVNQFNGQVQAVLVFNCPVTAGLAAESSRFADWLEPETQRHFYLGDSLTAVDQADNNSTTNTIVYYLQSRFPNEFCWRNDALSGSYLFGIDASFFTNFYFYGGLINKINEAHVYIANGINDLYGVAATPGVLIGHYTNICNYFHQADSRWKIWASTVQPTYTNASVNSISYYSTAIDAYRNTFNQMILTNSPLYSGIVRRDIFDI